jgi:glycerol-3-phosphate dehydrogenase (NAD(P)+)
LKVTVLGAGSWGTTLALVLDENKHNVTCWSFDQRDIEHIHKTHQNEKFLPGISLPETIHFTSDLTESVRDAGAIIVVVPTHAVRSVISEIKDSITDSTIWITASKGIENKTFLRMSELIAEITKTSPDKIAVLSGPSHAEEVSRKIPTAIVSASVSQETARLVQDLFMRPYFRVYTNTDVAGVELGGALKNIIAVAAGICDGAGFGDNTKAALMTRGLVEMNRLGVKLGANPDTFAGLSGMGDLVVTCMSQYSRNRFVGEQIGKGKSLQQVLDEMVMVAEGVKTTESIHGLTQKIKVDMPIAEEVYKTLFENKSAVQAMQDLMTRASKMEDWG